MGRRTYNSQRPFRKNSTHYQKEVQVMFRGLVACSLIGSFLLVLAGCGGSSKKGGSDVPFRKQVANAVKEPLAHVRAKMLIKIGYQQGKAGDRSGSEDTMRLAKAACEKVADPEVQAGVFAYLAEAEAKLGHRSEAREAVTSARQSAEKVEEKQVKAQTLARVGRALGTLKNADGEPETEEAVEILKTAEQLAAGLENVSGRTLVLCAVAGSYQRIGQPAEADRVFAAAREVAEKIEDARKRCDAIAAIAASQGEMKEKREAAEKTFESALEIAAKIEDFYSRTYAMADIAEKLSKAGFHAKTHEVLQEAEDLTQKIPEPDMQKRILERVRTLKHKLTKPRGEG